MYRRIDSPKRMTSNEAAEEYPDNFILFQMDNTSVSDTMGSVLYVGDNQSEMYTLASKIDAPLSGVIEGLNFHRNSLGGIVFGE